MKKIEAIIRPHKLNDVQDALIEAGVKGMTVYEARGVGRQKGHKEIYRGSEYEVGLLPKIKIEIIVADAQSDKVVDIILKVAKTGEIGDGKVFISTIDEAIRVRTQEAGESAL
jgi:nitrogen regulatory protein P-II 1